MPKLCCRIITEGSDARSMSPSRHRARMRLMDLGPRASGRAPRVATLIALAACGKSHPDAPPPPPPLPPPPAALDAAPAGAPRDGCKLDDELPTRYPAPPGRL